MRIGIDLGGTKTEIIALDRDGAVLVRHRAPTPKDDYDAILRSICTLVAFVETSTAKTGSIGIGTPGAISTRTGLIKNSNTAALNSQPLDRDLEKTLAREIRLENDANCLVLSEAIDGAAAGAHVVFGAILGTGVGGGITVGGRLLTGRNKIAGEWGHNPLPWAEADDARPQACYCGKSGCIETYLCGAGLSRGHLALTGENRTASEIAQAAMAGDPQAGMVLERYKDRLARSLAVIVNSLDPDVIVLGGGLSNIAELYTGLTAQVGKYAFSDGIDTPILAATHGDSSGVRGAALLWPETERYEQP